MSNTSGPSKFVYGGTEGAVFADLGAAGASENVDFRAVFRAIPSASAVIRLEAGEPQIVDASQGFLDLFNLERSSLTPPRIEDVFAPEVVTLISDASRKAIRHPDRLGNIISQRIISSQGELGVTLGAVGLLDQRDVLLIVEPLSRPVGYMQPRAAALDQLDAVSDNVIFIYDVEKARTHYVSSRAETLLGHPVGAVGLDQIRSVVHPADLANVMRRLAIMIRSPEDRVVTATFRVKDAAKTWKWMEARLRVLSRNKAGEVRRVIGVASDVTDRHELSLALQEASNAIAEAGEMERRRIARELHDSTVQHLVTLDWGLSELKRRSIGAFADDGIFDELKSALEAAQREIRVFAYMLHPPRLDQLGLVESLKRFVSGVSKRTGIRVDVEASGTIADLPSAVEIALFRVAQEALMNVHRHANASSALVSIDYGVDAVILKITDDGPSTPEAASRAEVQSGVGIAGMRARMSQLGGSIELKSSVNGWIVCAKIPRRAIARLE